MDNKTAIIGWQRWVGVSMLNLLIVAVLGALMRYKIGFSLPYLDQKYLQHAHSHFAFAGWVSQTLMLLMVYALHGHLPANRLLLYRRLLLINVVLAFGMLFSFAVQGYGPVSIVCSSGSILVFLWFAIAFTTDWKRYAFGSGWWFYAALLFGVLSIIGTAALVFMMVSKNIEQHRYLASVYWYLHFQYNGWFFFACMGLFAHYWAQWQPDYRIRPAVFWLFAGACLPAFGLSVLWAKLPLWIYVIVVVAAFAQVVGWVLLLQSLGLSRLRILWRDNQQLAVLAIFLLVAVTVKLALQLGSVMPSVSQLAFGFRPIVIAYLHLVLLGIITVFLLGTLLTLRLMSTRGVATTGLMVFGVGIFLNEMVLAVQGIASFSYTLIPHVDKVLFGIALMLLVGVGMMVWGQVISEIKGRFDINQVSR